MPDNMDWSRIADAFLGGRTPSGPVDELAVRLRETEIQEITEALDREVTAKVKPEASRLLLVAVRDAVLDHALTDDEEEELIHLQRLLRIDEGEVLAYHRDEVTSLLCEELERLLEDYEIDSDEAIRKTKLQAVLGLSYDEFVRLTAPEIEKVIVHLMHLFDPGAEGASPENVSRFRRNLAMLDTVYDLNSPDGARGPRSGYLYLLVNPSMPDLVKIGRTARAPDERVSELTSATGVPAPFILLYHLFVQDAPAAESWIHTVLAESGTRPSQNREFFSVSPSEAVELMMRARDAIALG